MLIFQFHHFIKVEYIEAYKEAILENVRHTVLEEGVMRFEVLQDKKDPSHFSLFEVYRDDEGRAAHLESEHFKKFRRLSQKMICSPGEVREMNSRLCFHTVRIGNNPAWDDSRSLAYRKTANHLSVP